MNIYSNLIEIHEGVNKSISVYISEVDVLFKIEGNQLNSNNPVKICNCKIEDSILASWKDESHRYVLYCKGNKIYILKEILDELRYMSFKNEFDIHIENFDENIRMLRTGIASFAIIDKQGDIIQCVEDIISNTTINITNKYKYKGKIPNKRFKVITKIKYNFYNIILTYDFRNNEYNIHKVKLVPLKENSKLEVMLRNRNDVIIKNKVSNESVIVNLRNIKRNKSEKIFDIENMDITKKENIIAIYLFNNVRYYIYNMVDGVYVGRNNGAKVVGANHNLKVFSIFNNWVIMGKLMHYGVNAFGKYESIYLRNDENKIGKFIRPFKNIKFLRRYVIAKISFKNLNIDGNIHHNILIGDDNLDVYNLYLRKDDKKQRRVKTYIYRVLENNVFVFRTNLQGDITSTIIPYSEEYSFLSRYKIILANLISSKLKKKNENINLYFEKKSMKADESAIHVFRKVEKLEEKKSKNLFILDGKAEKYKELKKEFGNRIVKKFSLKHYIAIFSADNFISSELSNHVLNDRLFIDKLRNKIMNVPLVFLQHGIMFAKPVDNPMAFGFHKDKNQYNIFKTVISSELEAGEFYKMKYDRDDLILTGLATFDYAKLDDSAEKIAFMPTYRYWEEGLIYNNKIEETTFYKSIIKVIKAFEKEDMLDKLLIVPHNKFGEYIYNNMPEYSHIISSNPSEALKKSKIFITDYSSAIYDAQYRGAYPIFYWEEKDYLIEKYKAIPPVNEDNAPGPIAYNVEELMKYIKDAIANDYKVSEYYKERYLKINQYNDNKNTERIVKFLQNQNII